MFLLKKKKFPVQLQASISDCGPTCLQMICSFFGCYFHIETLRRLSGFNHQGVSLMGIKLAAETLGLEGDGIRLTREQLIAEIEKPLILFWNQKHFVVLISADSKKFTIADPAQGLLNLTWVEFTGAWCSTTDEDGDPIGFALRLKPTDEFYKNKPDQKQEFDWKLVFRYLSTKAKKVAIVVLLILLSILCQILIPKFSQILVDSGIKTGSIGLVAAIIIGQLFVIVGKMVFDLTRSWIIIRIASYINLKMAEDFWGKLMRVPLSFFETRRGGDIYQKLSDTRQIQNFLTTSVINIIVSVLTFFAFAFVLFRYNPLFFLIFIAGLGVYYGWLALFSNMKIKLNYQSNALATRQNDLSLQFVQGMSEIRIGGGEKIKLKEWNEVQEMVIALNTKILKTTQLQTVGAVLISQSKDLFLIYLSATLIINHQLTLGALISIQYVLGALSGPVEQMVVFTQNTIDAKQSIFRLNDIYSLKHEEDIVPDQGINVVRGNIAISNLSFSYPGAGNQAVLKSLCLTIPENKVTAIVGVSGSGKTTLIKLLLKFFEVPDNTIKIGNNDIEQIHPKQWRSQCGAVLQDGYIFNNSIARNICIGDDIVDYERLKQVCGDTNIASFIQSLPNEYETLLGVGGMSVSQGQKQRILIARAIYNDPDFLFLDEATNALDSENEKIIINNLKLMYQGKTVIIIAHRLSTVRDADQIVVLEKGAVVEFGNHYELTELKGHYYRLVKNQLELGT